MRNLVPSVISFQKTMAMCPYEAENFMYNAAEEKVDPGIPQMEGATFTNACGGVDIGGAIGMVMYSPL
jgi:hypothetical protein